jgi:putative transposase
MGHWAASLTSGTLFIRSQRAEGSQTKKPPPNPEEKRRLGICLQVEDEPIRRKSRKSFDTPNHAHEVTFSTVGRQPILSRPGIAAQVVEAFDKARHRLEFDLWAFVVMPEHCHVLLHPKNKEYAMAPILKALKSPAAKAILMNNPELRAELAISTPHGVEYRLWLPGGGYDRNVFTAESAWNAIRYIHRNPVKRGLCIEPDEWKWSSAAAYNGGSSVIPVDICPWHSDI